MDRALIQQAKAHGVRICQAIENNQRLRKPGWEKRVQTLETMMRRLATLMVEEGADG